jgi:hypothetical protein
MSTGEDSLSWGWFVGIVVTNIFALYIGITTKVDSDDPRVRMLQGYARGGGFIIGIGGWLIAIRVLLILLKRS